MRQGRGGLLGGNRVRELDRTHLRAQREVPSVQQGIGKTRSGPSSADALSGQGMGPF